MGLSEPKRRVKYSIDPNALRWANDESKFGKRLMEKMGWQQGEGLGAKSNGMTEHVKVKLKMDTKGVGYNNNDYDNVWLDHQNDFESVLASLNKEAPNKEETTTETENKPAINPLVQKSKERSKRLHYSKFTKSKDLSMASQHDLACILGTDKRTKLKQEEEEKQQETPNDKSNESDLCFAKNPLFEPTAVKRKERKESVEVKAESQLLFKTNTMSISDYFAQKMKSKLNKIKSDESANDSSSASANEVVEQPTVEEQVEPKKKKKKSKHDKEETCVEEKQDVEIDETVEVEPEAKKKKKKKSKNKEEQTEEEKVVVVEEVMREEHVETITKKKKKKSKDKDQIVEEETTTTETTTEITEVKIEAKIRENSFPGSNLFQLYGYSPYNITCNLDAIIMDKSKKAAKKRQLAEKNLEKDPKFYEMLKKPSCVL